MTELKTLIQVQVDDAREMACVSIDGKIVMQGNFHDFHPGCHGITEYGDFKGYPYLVQAIFIKMIKDGKRSEDIEIRKSKYKYRD